LKLHAGIQPKTTPKINCIKIRVSIEFRQSLWPTHCEQSEPRPTWSYSYLLGPKCCCVSRAQSSPQPITTFTGVEVCNSARVLTRLGIGNWESRIGLWVLGMGCYQNSRCRSVGKVWLGERFLKRAERNQNRERGREQLLNNFRDSELSWLFRSRTENIP